MRADENAELMKLVLASQSPRRRQLLHAAGYTFDVIPPADTAECGICSRETPPEMVVRLARQKAQDVAQRVEAGIVIGCDTVAECMGQILGKPGNKNHALEILRLLRGRTHHVYSGLCLWRRPDDKITLAVERTRLVMDAVSDQQLNEYLESGLWHGKAGAFGLQDRLGWIRILEGSESNVVGLPMERLAELLEQY